MKKHNKYIVKITLTNLSEIEHIYTPLQYSRIKENLKKFISNPSPDTLKITIKNPVMLAGLYNPGITLYIKK